MWLTKRLGAMFLGVTLLFSLITGCGKGQENSANPKEDVTQEKQLEVDENPVPIVDVNLGMDPKAVVAEYEGGTLTAEQFENYLQVQAFINPQAGFAIQEKDPQSLKMFVESLVAEKLMAAKAPEVKNIDSEAKELAQRIKSQYLTVYGGDEKKLAKQMENQGVTDQELKDFFVLYKKVESYLSSQVTDAELQQSYDEEKKEHNFVVASVRHILIFAGEQPGAAADYKPRTDEEAKKLAQELADRLRKGEDFAKLAKEYSEDPGSKDNGGLYEDMDLIQSVPEFKKAAAELPLNTISDPVKTDYGYHVMKVEKRSEKTFDEVKEQLRSLFINTKYDEFLNKDLKASLKEENIHLPEKPKE